MQWTAALKQTAGLGDYFAIDTDPTGDWRPFTDLLRPDVLRERVAVVRRALAMPTGRSTPEIDQRAAASIHFLALASRLVAPALGCRVLTGAAPRLELDDLVWRPVEGGPVPVGLRAIPLDAAATEFVTPAVAALRDAFAGTFALSRQVLTGNVASALSGAAGMVSRARPDLAATARDVVERALADGALAGSAEFVGGAFVRHNCCLFYRVPGAGVCADCILRRPGSGASHTVSGSGSVT